MTVEMPVEVFNERCVNCPDLEIDTVTFESFDVSAVDDDGTIHQKNKYESRLRCTHCEECKIRYKAVFEEPKPEEKKKAKTPAKKTNTTRTRSKGATKK